LLTPSAHGGQAAKRYDLQSSFNAGLFLAVGKRRLSDGEYAETITDNPSLRRRGWCGCRQTGSEFHRRKLAGYKTARSRFRAGLAHIASNDGIQAFSRTFGRPDHVKNPPAIGAFLRHLRSWKDAGGGVREGDSVLIAGSSGTGIGPGNPVHAEGTRLGSRIVAVFEDARKVRERATSLGLALKRRRRRKTHHPLSASLDLSVDEHASFSTQCRRWRQRLVIDSLAGFGWLCRRLARLCESLTG